MEYYKNIFTDFAIYRQNFKKYVACSKLKRNMKNHESMKGIFYCNECGDLDDPIIATCFVCYVGLMWHMLIFECS